eukprot:6202994-Pleurochrysis_carterae.AAC.3
MSKHHRRTASNHTEVQSQGIDGAFRQILLSLALAAYYLRATSTTVIGTLRIIFKMAQQEPPTWLWQVDRL